MRIGGLQKSSLVDYPGKICAIVFTVGCNFRCPYCHNPELVDETAPLIDEEEVFGFLDSRTGKLDAVTVTGGEPTMHKDLLPFLKRIKEKGFLVKLDTNGTNPGMVKKALNEGLVDYLAMDIKAPLAAYSALVAHPVNTELIRESVRLLLYSGVPYEFRTTVVKPLLSPDDFDAIGALIRGATRYYLQKFVPTKILNPQFIKKVTYSDEEFADIRQKMLAYVDECFVR